MPTPAELSREGQDPFEMLGLTPSMGLSAEAIRRAHLRLQGEAHPDAQAAGSSLDDDEATLQAARLNHARQVLDNPESRADALLRRLGGPSKEQDKALPDGFLMRFMLNRQAADEELASDPQSRERWRAWGLARRAEHIAAVAAMLDPMASGAAPRSDEGLRAARRELNAWRYIERFLEQIDMPA